MVTADRRFLSHKVDRPRWIRSPYPLDRVRISTQATYNSGLFIADFRDFAYGPSVWPAFWGEYPWFFRAGGFDVNSLFHQLSGIVLILARFM